MVHFRSTIVFYGFCSVVQKQHSVTTRSTSPDFIKLLYPEKHLWSTIKKPCSGQGFVDNKKFYATFPRLTLRLHTRVLPLLTCQVHIPVDLTYGSGATPSITTLLRQSGVSSLLVGVPL